jgi:hypothetical protein
VLGVIRLFRASYRELPADPRLAARSAQDASRSSRREGAAASLLAWANCRSGGGGGEPAAVSGLSSLLVEDVHGVGDSVGDAHGAPAFLAGGSGVWVERLLPGGHGSDVPLGVSGGGDRLAGEGGLGRPQHGGGGVVAVLGELERDLPQGGGDSQVVADVELAARQRPEASHGFPSSVRLERATTSSG